jgi:chemotaxis protein CheD
MVRMGELVVSAETGMTLVGLGLGSCIGLVLLERARPIAGLAHIVLPDSNGATDAPVGKFADRAVPAILEQMRGLGATVSRLEAILVGGAQMFSLGSKAESTLNIGRRNEEATRAALAQAGVSIRLAETGGSTGRTVRVDVETGRVSVKQPGTGEVELFSRATLVGAGR